MTANEKSGVEPSCPNLCQDMDECHQKSRTFDMRVLVVTYSQFEEQLMLVDAHVLVLRKPMSLCETDKYQKTGTLF